MKAKGLAPIILGGGQEGGMRSGTENVPGIAAFGAAVDEGVKNLDKNADKMEDLREYLVDKLTRGEAFAEISITNPKSHAPHILNITLPDIKSETMLHFLSSYGIYVSSGSACSSNSSHVSSALIAFGRSEGEADCSIRISLSHRNTKEDVDKFIEVIKIGLSKLSRKK
jgi:cysteine desulfurase